VSCVGFNIKKKEVDIEGVVAVDKALDLALIQFDGKVTPLGLGNFDELAAGKKFYAVGVNESGDIIISDGAVRSFFDLRGGLKVADSTLAVPDTFSGGVILGDSGKVVGVIQVLEKRLRFIAPANTVAAMPKTTKMTPFKNWQLEDYMGTMEAAWLTGRLYAMMGEAYNAQKGLEKVTKAEPNNLEAWTLLAKVYDGQRDYQNAITAYKRVTELDSRNGDAFFGLGLIYARMQRSAEAVAALEKALEINPGNKEAVFYLGNAYEDAREFQKAGDAYEKYLSMKPENAWQAYQRLGMSRMNANQFEAAAAALEEARKAQPQDQNIAYNLAQAYERAQKLDRAEEVYKNLVQISPKDAETWYKYILNMYDKAKQPSKAIEAAKKIVELKPNDEQSLYNLAYMF
jgi:tetratricopeptide (TPR) repeat protein